MANVTVHLECTSAWERGKKLLASSGVDTAFLLNANPEQVQYALGNTTGIVVVRVFDAWNEYRGGANRDFEKDIVLRRKPDEFVQWLNASDYNRFKGNKRARFIISWNEMYYVDAAYQRRQNSAMVAIARALVQAGYGVAMFGMAADKTIQSQDAQSGVWDEAIEFAIQNSEWVHFDIHEYTVGRLASQHLKTYSVPYPQSIESPTDMRRDNWGKIDYSLKGQGNWHLGRISWLLARSREKFGKDFFWARGEMGWDYKDDGGLRSYIPGYMSRYGKPQGLPSLRALFNHLAGRSLSDTELCAEGYADLRWLVEQDPPSCLSNALFADNPHSEWASFNIGAPQFAHLQALLMQQSTVTPIPTPPPVETPLPPVYPDFALLPHKVRTLKQSNIRKTPDGELLSATAITTEWQDAYLSVGTYPKGGLQWHRIEINGLTGWVAKTTNFEFAEIAAPPPPEKRFYVMVGAVQVQVSESDLDKLIAGKRLELAALEAAKLDNVPF